MAIRDVPAHPFYEPEDIDTYQSMVMVTLRMPVPLRDYIDMIAGQESRTFANMVRKILEDYAYEHKQATRKDKA